MLGEERRAKHEKKGEGRREEGVGREVGDEREKREEDEEGKGWKEEEGKGEESWKAIKKERV